MFRCGEEIVTGNDLNSYVICKVFLLVVEMQILVLDFLGCKLGLLRISYKLIKGFVFEYFFS